MKIKDMPVYSLTKELEGYLREISDGTLDDKALDLIMKLKMNDQILIHDMYKVLAFNVLEDGYKRLGDELFSGKNLEGLKKIFKETFNY